MLSRNTIVIKVLIPVRLRSTDRDRDNSNQRMRTQDLIFLEAPALDHTIRMPLNYICFHAVAILNM